MALFEIALAAALAAQPAEGGSPVLVTGARFLGDGQGQAGATAIPHVAVSSCYRWEIDVAPQDRSMTIHERFELPAPAPLWGSGAATIVAPDRASAVTQIQESLSDGLLTHGWCVAEGDPVGPHRIIVYAGERVLYEFRFNVVRAPD